MPLRVASVLYRNITGFYHLFIRFCPDNPAIGINGICTDPISFRKDNSFRRRGMVHKIQLFDPFPILGEQGRILSSG